MKKVKINQKQIKLNRERQLAEKRKEFEAKYYEELALMKELGLNEEFPLEPLEKYIERECKEWEDKQLKVPTGMYQDWQKIASYYQQKFMEYTCKFCPDLIGDLRQFIPLFDELFGKNNGKYLAIFDSYRDNIFDLSYSLSNKINYSIIESRFLEFKPFRANTFDYSFRWGEYRLLFNLLARKLVSPENSEKQKELFDEILGLIREDLKLKQHFNKEEVNENDLRYYIEKNCLDIIEALLLGDKNNYFYKQANDSLTRYLKYVFRDNEPNYNSNEIEPNVDAFIKLQCEILNWAVRHNLGKDWILKYGYFFISEFSKNPELKVLDIKVGFLQARALAAHPFEFQFNGWFAGDEKREGYEDRLRESFEDNLAKYFHGIYDRFELDKKKRATRPKNYDRVKSLVRWTVQGWGLEKIVENDFEILDTIELKKKFDKKVKYLEEELPKFEKYELPCRMPCGKSLLKM